jgi:hypothetical protein
VNRFKIRAHRGSCGAFVVVNLEERCFNMPKRGSFRLRERASEIAGAWRARSVGVVSQPSVSWP